MAMFARLLPSPLDNAYRGHPAALWVFGAVVLLKGADTIVFVTDGRPTHGEMANRPERLRDEAWLVATLQDVRFETVGLHNHQFDLLQAMARDSGGLYVHAQENGDTAEPQDLEFWPAKKRAFEEARKARKKSGEGSG